MNHIERSEETIMIIWTIVILMTRNGFNSDALKVNMFLIPKCNDDIWFRIHENVISSVGFKVGYVP